MAGTVTTVTTPSKPQSSGAATGLALVGAVIATIANFGIALLIAGASTTLAGVFFATTAVITIAGNSSALGTMTALVYFLPSAMAEARPNPRSLLAIALAPVGVLSVSVSVALFAAAGPLARLVAANEYQRVATMLAVLALAVPCWAITVVALGATRGLASMTPTVLVNQIVRPLGQLLLIGTLTLASPDPSAVALAVAWLVPVVVGMALSLIAVVRLGGLVADGPPSVTRAEFWGYARPRAASAAAQIALERSDVILVSALAGEAAAGVYGTVTRFVTAGNFLVFAMGQASSGPLRRALVAGRTDRAQQLLDSATAWMVLTAGTYFLLVAFKADALLAVVNSELLAGSTALTVAALAMVINAMAGPVDLTLLMLGRSRASLMATAGALAIDITVAWLTIDRFGLTGAALAWGLAVVFQNLAAAYLVRRHGNLRPFGPPARLAALVAVVAVVPVSLATPNSLSGLLASTAGSGLILAAWAVVHAPTLGLDAGPIAAVRRHLPLSR